VGERRAADGESGVEGGCAGAEDARGEVGSGGGEKAGEAEVHGDEGEAPGWGIRGGGAVAGLDVVAEGEGAVGEVEAVERHQEATHVRGGEGPVPGIAVCKRCHWRSLISVPFTCAA
jgi:hypothetical protein